MTTKTEFIWISSENPDQKAFIAVDKQLRLYFNRAAKNMIGDKTYIRPHVYLGYDFANKRITVGVPGVVRPVNVESHRLDKRGYTSARPFIKSVGLSEADLPLRYEYVGKDHNIDGAHAFELINDDRAGGDGRL